jgi:hypothetical protein
VEDILEATSMSDLNEVGQVPNLGWPHWCYWRCV